MRRYLAPAILFLTFLLLIGCRDFGNPFDPANNRPPIEPSDPTPVSGAQDQDTLGLVLTWQASDPDTAAGDEVGYDVYFGTTNQPPIADSGLTTNQYEPGALAVGSVFYWKVVAKDTRGDSTAGPVWSFTTDDNLVPEAPSDPSPGDSASSRVPSLTLRWQASDPNQGDSLVFDVYLGTTPTPGLVSSGVAENAYTPGNLSFGTVYYWQVVARDLDSAETAGPVWQFSTMAQVTVTEPAAGARWRGGTTRTVRWTGGTDRVTGHPRAGLTRSGSASRAGINERSARPGGPEGTDDTDSTVVYYSTNNGGTWVRAGRAAAQNSYDWELPSVETGQALVQLRVHAGEDVATATSGSFEIYGLPTDITVTAPSAGARWRVGTAQTVAWTGGTDATDSSTVYFSSDGGSSWARQGLVSEQGRFDWTVPGPDAERARVQVRAYVAAESTVGTSGQFEVYELAPVTVTVPNSGTRWRWTTNVTFEWDGGATAADSTVVYWKRTEADPWTRLGLETNPGRYEDWLVPEVQSSRDARAQVRAYRYGETQQGTSEPFEIYNDSQPSQIQFSSPAGGEQWMIGTTHDITWSGGTFGVDSTVVLYSTDGGTNWTRQGVALMPGSFEWTVPAPATNEARVGLQAWCVNRQAQAVSEQFSVVDTGGPPPDPPDSVVATVDVGDEPVAICWNSQSNKVYTANYDSDDVTIVNGGSNQVITTVDVGALPIALACDNTRNKVYVVNFGGGSVSVIDGQSNNVVKTIDVGSAPRAILLNTSASRGYVANWGSASRSVSVIDLATDSVIGEVRTDTRPWALAYNPTANKVYVAGRADNEVWVIDPVTNTVIDTVNVGVQPCAFAVHATYNTVFVADTGNSKVSVIDGNSNEVLSTIDQVRAGPCALAWNSTSDKVYSADAAGDNVSIIDPVSYVVTGYLPMASRPRFVYWAPWANALYVSRYGSDQVVALDGETNATIAELATGGGPLAICGNPTNNRVYVANQDAGTITVLGRSQ